MNKLEKLASKAINTIIGIEIYGWPPVCFGTFYQPKRPETKHTESIGLPREKTSSKNFSIARSTIRF